MKRTMYYKTKWDVDHPPFICVLANKVHYPKVAVWVETPAGFDSIPYKDIDVMMYKTRKSTFEELAENIAKGLVKKIEGQKKKGLVKVTVRVVEDPDFWVEAVEEKEMRLQG